MNHGTATPHDRSGLLYGLGAHAFWGSMPLYLLLVRQVPAVEFVAWRIVFTLPLCFAVVAWRGSGAEMRRVLADSRAMLRLLASATMVGVNWLIYVWAIQSGHVYAASIGYYILPLMMMLLGLLVLGEEMTRRQWVAAALAACGVASLTAGAVTTLWVSITMAATFALDGLLRKTVAAGPLVGLTIESLILLPLALAIAAWYAATPAGPAIVEGWGTALAIAWGGPMTAVPLLLFAVAVRKLPYTVLGFLQFISPTIVFLLGLTVFGEELQPAQLAAFVLIWTAAALFIWDQLRRPSRPAAAS